MMTIKEIETALKAMTNSETTIELKTQIRDKNDEAFIFTFSFNCGRVNNTSVCVVYDYYHIVFTPCNWRQDLGFDGTENTLNSLANCDWLAYYPKSRKTIEWVKNMNGMPVVPEF